MAVWWLVVLVQPALADVAANAGAAGLEPPVVYRLANGLLVLLQRDTRNPEIALMVAYGVGTRDDPVGKKGLAHLVEHMTYRGSRHLKPYDALAQLQLAGATELNGVTTPDQTIYFAALPREALARALWVESERMGFTLERFDENSLTAERQTVISESLLKSDSMDRRFDAHMYRALFGEQHPYAVQVFPEHDLGSIQLADVQRCFQRAYRPDNAQLILVGDFAIAAAEAQIEKYFGPIRNPAFPLTRLVVAAPTIHGPRQLQSEGSVSAERFTLSWLLPPASPRARLLMGVLRTIWQRQLSRRLRVEQAVATDVEVTLDTLELAGRLAIEVTAPRHGTASQAATAVLKYVAEFWRTDFRQDFADVVRVARLAAAESSNQPLEVAARQLWMLRATGAPFDREQELQQLAALRLKDLYELTSVLQPQNAALGWLVHRRGGAR